MLTSRSTALCYSITPLPQRFVVEGFHQPGEKTLRAGCSKRYQRRGARKFHERSRTQAVRWSEAIDGSTGLTMSGVAHI